MFAADVLMLNGLATVDRAGPASRGGPARDAVHADRTFFATCGMLDVVKTAMISVAGPGEKLLLARNAHKFVMAGLIISGIDRSGSPRHDKHYQLTQPPGPAEIGPLLRRPSRRERACWWCPDRLGQLCRPARDSPPSAMSTACRSSWMRRGAHTCRSTTGCPVGAWTPARTSW